jgi:hypothetical protein
MERSMLRDTTQIGRQKPALLNQAPTSPLRVTVQNPSDSYLSEPPLGSDSQLHSRRPVSTLRGSLWLACVPPRLRHRVYDACE